MVILYFVCLVALLSPLIFRGRHTRSDDVQVVMTFKPLIYSITFYTIFRNVFINTIYIKTTSIQYMIIKEFDICHISSLLTSHKHSSSQDLSLSL